VLDALGSTPETVMDESGNPIQNSDSKAPGDEVSDTRMTLTLTLTLSPKESPWKKTDALRRLDALRRRKRGRVRVRIKVRVRIRIRVKVRVKV